MLSTDFFEPGLNRAIPGRFLILAGTSRCDVASRAARAERARHTRVGSCAAGRGADGAARRAYREQFQDTPGSIYDNGTHRQVF